MKSGNRHPSTSQIYDTEILKEKRFKMEKREPLIVDPFVSRLRFLQLTAAGMAGAAVASAGLGSLPAFAAGKPYAGVTLNFIGEATTQTDVIKALLPQFTQQTGISVNIEEAPYDSVVQKEILDFTTHRAYYDVESMPYEYLGTYVDRGYIVPVDTYLANTGLTPASFDKADIISKLWNAASNWKGKFYGFPSESPVMMMFYRSDLFSNPIEQRAFHARYGYNLAPAKTWAQYQDIAAFFTRQKGQSLAGKTLSQNFYGLAMTGKRHLATVCEWLNYAWSFGGGIFDQHGNLILNSAANKQALNYWVGLTKFAPPGYTTYTWDEVTSAIQQSTVAQAIQWGDTASAAEDPTQSKVTGKLGFADIPAMKAGGKVVAHYGGWSYVINKDSAHPEAAYLFMLWASSKSTQLQLSQRGGLPARISVFKDPALGTKLPYWNQELRSLSISTSRPRIAQWGELASTLQLTLSQILSHEVSVDSGLQQAQATLSSQLKSVLPVSYQ